MHVEKQTLYKYIFLNLYIHIAQRIAFPIKTIDDLT